MRFKNKKMHEKWNSNNIMAGSNCLYAGERTTELRSKSFIWNKISYAWQFKPGTTKHPTFRNFSGQVG
jgi:hypothetical protein